MQEADSAMTDSTNELPYRWSGGHPALDFTNTVAWDAPDDGTEVDRPIPRYERLTSYERLVDWSVHGGLISAHTGEALTSEATRRPDDAARVLERAAALREAIHRLFMARARGGLATADALEALNEAYREGSARRVLVDGPDGFALAWQDDEACLEAPLWPIALAAAHLLASDAAEHVRACAGKPCGFLFLDTSRGHRRRWCDMADCGNLAKARRHRARARRREAVGA
jgi:predicted RNA-binding Zn ribbon-like protein